jgi:hypothetical protein
MADTGYNWPATSVFALLSGGGDWDDTGIADGVSQASQLIDLDVSASVEITIEFTMAAGTTDTALDIAFLADIAGSVQQVADAKSISRAVEGGESYQWQFSFMSSDWSKIGVQISNNTNVAITVSDVRYKLSTVPPASA